jgi:ClpP class serine protease
VAVDRGENRGLSDGALVRETQARVFRADEALALRLIDGVKTPAEAVASFMAELADDEDSSEEDEDMATEATSGSGAAAAPAANAAPTADQIQAAITADRERMTAIKALPESAERPKLADKLALDGYTVDQAKSLLAVAAPEPKAAAAPEPAAKPAGEQGNQVDTTNHLDAAMDRTKQPNVGAGGDQGSGQGGGEKTDADLSNAILADQAGLTGVNFGERKS